MTHRNKLKVRRRSPSGGRKNDALVDTHEESEATDVVVELLHLLPADVCAPLRVVQCGSMRGVAVVGEGTDMTGLFVWPGARVFCHFLAALRLAGKTSDALSRAWGCTGLVELGGGVGLGAFSASLMWSGLESWVTDIFEEALVLALAQREANLEELSRQRSDVRLGILDWQWPAAAERRTTPQGVPTHSQHDGIVVMTPSAFHQVVCGLPSADSVPSRANEPPQHAPQEPPPRGVPWLVGLDIVYPDHSDDNMHNLCGCIAAALRARDVAARGGSCPNNCSFVHKSVLTQQCTLLFIDRDVAVTLRRLLLCATMYGLVVSPLVTPYESKNGGGPTGDDAVDGAFALAAGRIADIEVATLASLAKDSWAATTHGVGSCIDKGTLPLNVSSGGEWLLCVSLGHAQMPPTTTLLGGEEVALSVAARTPQGTQLVTRSGNAIWVSALPWMWPPEQLPDRWDKWQRASSVAAVATACCRATGASSNAVEYDIDWQHNVFDMLPDAADDMLMCFGSDSDE